MTRRSGHRNFSTVDVVSLECAPVTSLCQDYFGEDPPDIDVGEDEAGIGIHSRVRPVDVGGCWRASAKTACILIPIIAGRAERRTNGAASVAM